MPVLNRIISFSKLNFLNHFQRKFALYESNLYSCNMQIHIENKTPLNINKTSILQQTAFWSQVKRNQGLDSKAFDIKVRSSDLVTASPPLHYILDDVLILFQEIGDGCQIGYVPYGPTIKPHDEIKGTFLEELSESLRPHLPQQCILLRWDLLWESLCAKDDNYYDDHGNWLGPPATTNQEIRLNFETENWNLKKANTDILPSDTIFIDLNKDTDQLLKAMKSKTRYNVRLSQRKGVRVRRTDLHDLGIWYNLYRETCERNKICLHNMNYFQAVLATHVSNAKSPADVELLIAEVDHTPLAAMFLVFSGQRATYLYGASSSRNRHFMATYALQWEAIKRAHERGCAEYDMFGVAPHPDPGHPLYGLYRFKSGFGGHLFHRMGCWDYPLNMEKYEQYVTAEMHSQGYHLR